MKLTGKQQHVIDVIQWILIIFLVFVCIFNYFNNTNDKLITSEEYKKELSYIKIYESQTIEALKKENNELYDSIKRLKNVESAVEIKYVYKFKTDTIKVNEFKETDDSVYQYAQKNDTIDFKVNVKAKDLKWVQTDLKINDKFTIINKELEGLNQTMVSGSDNVEIQNVDAWHRKDKQKWYNNFVISPQVGVGVGMINKKLDVYVGVGVGYKF